jgi:hypothetical protein
MTVNATGEAATGGTLYIGFSFGEAPCQTAYTGGQLFQELGFQIWYVPGPSFAHSFAFYLQETGDHTPICGYVVEGGVGDYTTTAFAELSIVYGPSAAELRHEKEVAERQTAERLAQQRGEEVKTAEAKASEERQAKERYEAGAPARKVAEEEEARARIDAELNQERTLAHKKPVMHLSVRPEARHSRSSQAPGETVLYITTDPFAYVTVKLSRYGHSTLHLEWINFTRGEDVIPWSCHSPGSVYKYVVMARSGVGPSITRRGRFAPVSASRCRTLKREEAEARERREHKYAEERQEEERKFDQEVAEKEDNCRKMGDHVVYIHSSEEGPRWVCVTPGGVDVPVPY